MPLQASTAVRTSSWFSLRFPTSCQTRMEVRSAPASSRSFSRSERGRPRRTTATRTPRALTNRIAGGTRRHRQTSASASSNNPLTLRFLHCIKASRSQRWKRGRIERLHRQLERQILLGQKPKDGSRRVTCRRSDSSARCQIQHHRHVFRCNHLFFTVVHPRHQFTMMYLRRG